GFVSFGVNLADAGQARLLLRSNDHLDLAGDSLSDFTLRFQDIAYIALVVFGPQMLVGGRMDQLRADEQAVAGTLHRPFDHSVPLQFTGDLRKRFLRALVTHGRSPRDHA